jgi:Domain of unknown function (DUF4263)
VVYPVTLPGLREYAERLPPEVAPRDEYERLLGLAWRSLLESPAGQVEANLQVFLEHHPCLRPGFRSMDIESGHGPYPAAVIRQPKLPGLTTRRPDFCWIATDSERINPVLIEIETPDKQWFVHDGRRRGEQHSDLVHARGQLDRWKAWFAKPDNQMAFFREYRLGRWPLEHRELVPQYVLIHGSSRREFSGNPDLNELRRALQSPDTFMMTFDRLAPSRDTMSFGCVQITERGYEAVAVPPTFDVDMYSPDVAGLDRAIEACEDITEARKRYLIDQLGQARRFNAGEIPQFRNHINIRP